MTLFKRSYSNFRDLAAALERKRKYGIDALQYVVCSILPVFFWTVVTNIRYVFKLFWVYSHYVTSGWPKAGWTLYKSVEFVKPYGTIRVLEQRVSCVTLWLFPFKYLFKWKFLTKLSIFWSPIWNTMNKYMHVHVNCFLWTFI